MTQNLIKFQNQNIELVMVNDIPYLRGRQIGSALNLSFPQKEIQSLQTA